MDRNQHKHRRHQHRHQHRRHRHRHRSHSPTCTCASLSTRTKCVHLVLLVAAIQSSEAIGRRGAAKALMMLPPLKALNRGPLVGSFQMWDEEKESGSVKFFRRPVTAEEIAVHTDFSTKINKRTATSRARIGTHATVPLADESEARRITKLATKSNSKYCGRARDKANTGNHENEVMWGITRLLVPKSLRHAGTPVPGLSIGSNIAQSDKKRH